MFIANTTNSLGRYGACYPGKILKKMVQYKGKNSLKISVFIATTTKKAASLLGEDGGKESTIMRIKRRKLRI